MMEVQQGTCEVEVCVKQTTSSRKLWNLLKRHAKRNNGFGKVMSARLSSDESRCSIDGSAQPECSGDASPSVSPPLLSPGNALLGDESARAAKSFPIVLERAVGERKRSRRALSLGDNSPGVIDEAVSMGYRWRPRGLGTEGWQALNKDKTVGASRSNSNAKACQGKGGRVLCLRPPLSSDSDEDLGTPVARPRRWGRLSWKGNQGLPVSSKSSNQCFTRELSSDSDSPVSNPPEHPQSAEQRCLVDTAEGCSPERLLPLPAHPDCERAVKGPSSNPLASILGKFTSRSMAGGLGRAADRAVADPGTQCSPCPSTKAPRRFPHQRKSEGDIPSVQANFPTANEAGSARFRSGNFDISAAQPARGSLWGPNSGSRLARVREDRAQSQEVAAVTLPETSTGQAIERTSSPRTERAQRMWKETLNRRIAEQKEGIGADNTRSGLVWEGGFLAGDQAARGTSERSQAALWGNLDHWEELDEGRTWGRLERASSGTRAAEASTTGESQGVSRPPGEGWDRVESLGDGWDLLEHLRGPSRGPTGGNVGDEGSSEAAGQAGQELKQILSEGRSSIGAVDALPSSTVQSVNSNSEAVLWGNIESWDEAGEGSNDVSERNSERRVGNGGPFISYPVAATSGLLAVSNGQALASQPSRGRYSGDRGELDRPSSLAGPAQMEARFSGRGEVARPSCRELLQFFDQTGQRNAANRSLGTVSNTSSEGRLSTGPAGAATGMQQLRLADNNNQAHSSVSRIIALAEALFQVLDEIQRASAAVSAQFAAISSTTTSKPSPAPLSVVEGLPCRVFDLGSKKGVGQDESQPQCYICLNEYENGDSLRLLPCSHEYHATCVDKWLQQVHRVCPLCRHDVCEPANGHSLALQPP